MGRDILVIADVKNGKLRNVSLEMLHKAAQLAGDGKVHGLLIGSQVKPLAEEWIRNGAKRVHVADQEILKDYTPDAYVQVVCQIIDKEQPGIVMLAHSAIGRDLAPALAAKYQAGQVSDAIAITEEDGRIVCTRPIYAGKAYTKVALPTELSFITVRPNNLGLGEADGSNLGEVVESGLDISKDSLRTFIREVVQKSTTGVDLSEAKIIVSGGRGVKSADGFAPLQQLADVLQAAVGASRGACDAGYCDYALQIGQTGKVVTPDLYIACGISGAIQHLAGMSSSKVIVAINKDPEAPIFKVADYGIVGDLFAVVPMLTEEFKRLLA
ncbi:electron transfer flavoprotein subunit alpha/FixB family protein [Fodinisporobacter ferrooxydans]|uniref:Electron transfer flavoprotein subunit alpha/FixB family protein n=1 Tax=Fodinisporobacter ferrooxydans TaxID=2901836 RepID=A0ABY4CJ73_9BACL|nr:electron transfer flavoprotein subunit alpha/FixB family protein [Alicyclobacillaceae bacterium MYW30-H2]